MKLASAVLTGLGSSEIAWHWYTASVMTISQSLELAAILIIAIACGVIGWGLEV